MSDANQDESTRNIILASVNNDYLQGTEDDDEVNGGSGNDYIYGYSGDDILQGGAGHDYISAGSGNDTLIYDVDLNTVPSSSYYYDYYDAGSGYDTLIINMSEHAYSQLWLRMTLLDIQEQLANQGSNSSSSFHYADPDKEQLKLYIVGIEALNVTINGQATTVNASYGLQEQMGDNSNNVLYANFNSYVLYGLGGNDILFGHSGTDVLIGGDGDDSMVGYNGDDWLRGNNGNDYMDAGNGNDHVDGGAGNDRMFGGRGDDIVEGGIGNDTLYGNDGEDILKGEAGFDKLYGGAGGDSLDGGDGNDSLQGDAGNDYVFGGNGQDQFHYHLEINNGNYDYYDGGLGFDTLNVYLSSETYAIQGIRDQLRVYQDKLHNSAYGNIFHSFSNVEEFLGLSLSSIEQINIFVDDVNVGWVQTGEDYSKPVNQAPYNIALAIFGGKVYENTPAGREIAIISSENDNGETARYTLLSPNSPFAIDATSGRLSVKSGGSLDFEAAGMHDFTVKVDDQNGNYTLKSFRIRLENIVEHMSDIRFESDGVYENTPNALVGTVTADRDATVTKTYSLVQGGDVFDIDAYGRIYVKAGVTLDYETQNSYDITVNVNDGLSSVNRVFSVGVKDIDDGEYQIHNSFGIGFVGGSLSENAVAGTKVGQVSYLTKYNGNPVPLDNVEFSWLGISNHPYFELDQKTGIITIKEGVTIDYEALTEPFIGGEFKVAVINPSLGVSFASAPIEVKISNQLEQGEMLTLYGDKTYVNAERGSFVGKLVLADSKDSLSYRMLKSETDAFTVDQYGSIRVWDTSTLEAGEDYQVNIEVTNQNGQSTITRHFIDVVESDNRTFDLEVGGTLKGKGQAVAVIDTGIDWTHPAFGGSGDTSRAIGSPEHRIIAGIDLSNNDSDPQHDNTFARNHGTYVTSVIASDGKYAPSWAPEVSIVAVKVFGQGGTTTRSGENWVLDNLDAFNVPITTVNMSYGADGNDLSQESENFAYKAMVDKGVFLSAATGNDFENYGYNGSISPSTSAYTIAAGAHDRGLQIADFSQRTDTALYGFGFETIAVKPIADGGSVSDTGVYYGTSFGAPQVSGASIILRELMAILGIEDINQTLLYEHLMQTADLQNDLKHTRIDYNILNMKKAIEALMPADDAFANDVFQAYDLGSVDDNLKWHGFISAEFEYDFDFHNYAPKDIVSYDADFYKITAARDGTLEISGKAFGASTIDMEWIFADVDPIMEGDKAIFEVVADQEITFGITSSYAIGHYQLDFSYTDIIGETEVAPPPLYRDGTEAADFFNVFDNEVISGLAGEDTFYMQGKFSRVDGGLDRDIMYGFTNASDNKYFGAEGDDFILVFDYGRNFIHGGEGNDTLYAWGTTPNDNTIVGGTGNDTIYVYSDNNLIYGGPDDDRIVIHGNNNTISAGGGSDTVTSGVGDDTYQYKAYDNKDAYDTFTAGDGFDIFEIHLYSSLYAEDWVKEKLGALQNAVNSGDSTSIQLALDMHSDKDYLNFDFTGVEEVQVIVAGINVGLVEANTQALDPGDVLDIVEVQIILGDEEDNTVTPTVVADLSTLVPPDALPLIANEESGVAGVM